MLDAEVCNHYSASPVPFDAIAGIYDDRFTNSLIGRAQRDVIWQELQNVFLPGQRILDINCGTGVDAIYLASRGIEVVACDVSPQMIAVARRRAQSLNLSPPVDFRVLAMEEISALEGDSKFDGILSNFAGLNCIEDLPSVARKLAHVVKPRAKAVLCVFGPFCAWEVFWNLIHGDLRKAFRRLSRRVAAARVADNTTVRVYYPSARGLACAFSPWFRLERYVGVGIAVPPSYLEFLAARFPKALRAAARLDEWLRRSPLRRVADHILLVFQRSET